MKEDGGYNVDTMSTKIPFTADFSVELTKLRMILWLLELSKSYEIDMRTPTGRTGARLAPNVHTCIDTCYIHIHHLHTHLLRIMSMSLDGATMLVNLRFWHVQNIDFGVGNNKDVRRDDEYTT